MSVFTKEEHDLIRTAFNALMKVPNVDAVGITYTVGAIMTKVANASAGDTPAPAAPASANGEAAVP